MGYVAIAEELRAKFIDHFDQLHPALSLDRIHQINSHLVVRMRHGKRTVWLYLIPIHAGTPAAIEPHLSNLAIARFETDIRKHLPELRDFTFHYGFIAKSFGPSAFALAEKEDVALFDLGGRALVSVPGIYIARGLPVKPVAIETSERQEIPNTRKAEWLMRVLTCNPKELWSLAELTEALPLSAASITRLLSVFIDDGWVLATKRSRKGYTVAGKNAILDYWAARFRYFLAERVYLRPRGALKPVDEVQAELHVHLRTMGIKHAFTGFAAASQMSLGGRYSDISVYAQCTATEARDLGRKMGLEVGTHGSISILRPLDERYFYLASLDSKLPHVHPVQIYLDLLKTPLRGEEDALRFKDRHLDLDAVKVS